MSAQYPRLREPRVGARVGFPAASWPSRYDGIITALDPIHGGVTVNFYNRNGDERPIAMWSCEDIDYVMSPLQKSWVYIAWPEHIALPLGV